MWLLNKLFRKHNINFAIEEFNHIDHAILLDVRSEKKYAKGNIPGSVNIPLEQIYKSESKIPNKAHPVFVYCRSGIKSCIASIWLKNAGYSNVKNIGGIINYRGNLKTEKNS